MVEGREGGSIRTRLSFEYREYTLDPPNHPPTPRDLLAPEPAPSQRLQGLWQLHVLLHCHPSLRRYKIAIGVPRVDEQTCGSRDGREDW
jgi:hypothetical protein